MKIHGSSPPPRRLATVNYLEDLNALFVYGGKNDEQNTTFNDIYLLDLLSLNWYYVRVFDGIAKERYEHCAVVADNQIVIFGGVDRELYIASDLYVITANIY